MARGKRFKRHPLPLALPHPASKSGTFYLAEKRNFLLCVDNAGLSFRVAKACRALRGRDGSETRPGMARDVRSLFSNSGENQFLVLEDFVEGRLILFDHDLVGKNGLLIFHDAALVGED